MTHLIESKRQLLKIKENSGVDFTIHDLRRTFLTIAESIDIGPFTLKRLVNHKTADNNDVTAGYIVVDIERLNKATQRITDHILKTAGIQKNAKIVNLKTA